MKKIYKYIGPNILDIVLNKKGYFGLKCSYPKDYNDPYELFLAINFDETPDLLAFYKESIGNIPQKPTTCFSNSPIITPMWAHYAHNHKGFVIELDEELIKKYIDDVIISDIKYQDEANPKISDMMYRAYTMCKPRHSYLFWQSIMDAAYFTKSTYWSYEKEKRLITEDKNITIDKNNNMILYVPIDCISSIIAGARTDNNFKEKAQKITSSSIYNYYEMKIGKSSIIPYFINENNETYEFKDGQIIKSNSFCQKCLEPISNTHDLCSWCSINNGHIKSATESNPMRMLGEVGILDNYLAEIQKISKKIS